MILQALRTFFSLSVCVISTCNDTNEWMATTTTKNATNLWLNIVCFLFNPFLCLYNTPTNRMLDYFEMHFNRPWNTVCCWLRRRWPFFSFPNTLSYTFIVCIHCSNFLYFPRASIPFRIEFKIKKKLFVKSMILIYQYHKSRINIYVIWNARQVFFLRLLDQIRPSPNTKRPCVCVKNAPIYRSWTEKKLRCIF